MISRPTPEEPPPEPAGLSGPAEPPEPAAQVRRPPYGRNPTLAAHGVRARAEMIAAARDLFARNGYHLTTVEAIGEATGRSGAAVYQYFHGKAEIFGIFLQEAGAELGVLGTQFPVLTDDLAGQQALQRWISRVVDLLERHRTTFLMWAPIQLNEPGLAAIGAANLDGFQAGIVQRLAASGAHPPAATTAPVGILSVVEWSYFLYLARNPPIARDHLERAIAVVLHAYLYATAKTGGPGFSVDVGRDELPSIPLGDALGLRRPVTARGVGTVQRILLAAADRFRVNGFQGTTLSDVAATAGVSHGSVYTYWSDRDALFATLARDALNAVEIRIADLARALRTANGLAAWIEGWSAMLAVHGAALYVWTHEVTDDPQLAEATERMNALLDEAAATLVASSTRAAMVDPSAMGVVMRAVLTDVPFVLSVQLGILPPDASCAFVAGLLSAGVGAPPAGPSER